MRKYDFNYTTPTMNGGITTLDDINRISPFFTDTNPVTYAIFLEANKNKLTQEEIEKTQNLISGLSQKEFEAMSAISKFLKDKHEYETIAETVDIKVNELINNEVNNVVYREVTQSVDELSSSSSSS